MGRFTHHLSGKTRRQVDRGRRDPLVCFRRACRISVHRFNVGHLLNLAVGLLLILPSFESLNQRTRFLVGRTPWQDVRRRFGHDLAADLRLKPGNDGQRPLHTAHFVDRQPEAVRVPQLRLAIVLFKRFGREDVLVDRLPPQRVFAAIVEQVDGERPFHLDGRLALPVVEHEPPAETAFRGLPRLVENVVRPHVDDAIGNLRLVVGTWPRQPFRQIEGGAPRSHKDEERQELERLLKQSSGHDGHDLTETFDRWQGNAPRRKKYEARSSKDETNPNVETLRVL